MLTQSELKRRLDYDPQTGVFKWRKNPDHPSHWNTRRAGTIAGSHRTAGKPPHYRFINLDQLSYSEHRLAWLYVYGEWPKYEIDHINGNPVDNRIENLRDVTKALNQRNRKGQPGVIWNRRFNKWEASLRKGGKLYRGGFFDSKEAAIQSRLALEKLYWQG